MESAPGDMAGLQTAMKKNQPKRALTLLVKKFKSITLPNPEVYVLKTETRELRELRAGVMIEL